MINLLPYDNKRQIRAARFNIILAKCMLFLLFAIIFLALSFTSAYLYLDNSRTLTKSQNTKSVESNNSAKSVLSQANSITSDLAAAKTILNKQITYSDIITSIASALPSGVILDALSVNATTIGFPSTLSLHTTSAEISNDILTNFRKNKLFSNVSISSVNKSEGGQSGYSYSIIMRVTINKATKI